VICGPTAAGKSAVAMHLARLLDDSTPITIISADSRQIYRGFDIGTAKPTPEEQAAVPHECINIIEPTERCSAWQWAELARAAIARAYAAGRTPVIVGGTGFYIRALTDPLHEAPELDVTRRALLNAWIDEQSPALLRAWCERLDPERAPFGPVQWRRAIEVALLTGERLSSWHARPSAAEPIPVRYLLVDPGPSLAHRIAARVGTMLEQGWIDEVTRLRVDVPVGAPAWLATGYAEVLAHADGQLTFEEMRTRVTIRTRQYAKRQRTWFRHQLASDRVTRVAPDTAGGLDQAWRWWHDQHEERL
jgi:tRNA dimethylallyltransferase